MRKESQKKLVNNVIVGAIVVAALYFWAFIEPHLIKLASNLNGRWCNWRANRMTARAEGKSS